MKHGKTRENTVKKIFDWVLLNRRLLSGTCPSPSRIDLLGSTTAPEIMVPRNQKFFKNRFLRRKKKFDLC